MTRDGLSTPARLATATAIGLLAGLAASFAMDRFQALTRPSSGSQGEPATEQAADGVATVVTGEPLSDDARPAAGQAVHYALGAALGTAYGLAAEVAPAVTAGGGTAFASATWALLDEAIVPAVGLGNPPWQSSAGTQAYGFASHLVFGVSAELVRRLAGAAVDHLLATETPERPESTATG